MRAAIVAVGTELLGTDRLDTNSLFLTGVLRRHGVELVRKAVVGDDEEEIARTVAELSARAELVLLCGGLGPTADDVTREAVAACLGRGLEDRPEILAGIEAKFAAFGMRMPAINRREARVVEGAELLANSRGTAPGMWLDADGVTLFLFPGVPRELEAMARDHLEPWLERRSRGRRIETVTLKVACLPESHVEERIAPAYEEFGRSAITVLGSPGEVRVRLSASGGEEERGRLLAAMRQRIAALVGEALFADREETELEAVVGQLLGGRGETVVTAESCTGGLVAERLTRVAGSSEWFLGGAVAYSNRLKGELLGVPAGLIEAHGAVSEEVARAMAAGARRRLGGDWAVAITGIAGPGGGSEEKPVGTVHFGIARPAGAVSHRRLRLPGDRGRVRQLASQWALELLRRELSAAGAAGEGGA